MNEVMAGFMWNSAVTRYEPDERTYKARRML